MRRRSLCSKAHDAMRRGPCYVVNLIGSKKRWEKHEHRAGRADRGSVHDPASTGRRAHGPISDPADETNRSNWSSPDIVFARPADGPSRIVSIVNARVSRPAELRRELAVRATARRSPSVRIASRPRSHVGHSAASANSTKPSHPIEPSRSHLGRSGRVPPVLDLEHERVPAGQCREDVDSLAGGRHPAAVEPESSVIRGGRGRRGISEVARGSGCDDGAEAVSARERGIRS